MWGRDSTFFFFSPNGSLAVPKPFVEKSIFPPLTWISTFTIYEIIPICIGVYFWTSQFITSSVYLYIVLIIAALAYSSISVQVSSTDHSFSEFSRPFFFFFFYVNFLQSLCLVKKRKKPFCVFLKWGKLRERHQYDVDSFYPQFSSSLNYLFPTEKVANGAVV